MLHALSHYIHSRLSRYWNNLFSGVCLLCQGNTFSQFDLCKACEAELPYLGYSCIKCALPLAFESADQICITCLATQVERPYRVFSVFHYEFPIDRVILSLKYRSQLSVSSVLGCLMADKMQKLYQNSIKPDVIIPVPLHSARLQRRGFNQALEIARPISRALSIPVDYYSCKRIHQTKPQTELSAQMRVYNVRNAFVISESFHANHVCIVDDVFTTGNTSMALSTSLFKAGVQSIDIWCCARVSLKRPNA